MSFVRTHVLTLSVLQTMRRAHDITQAKYLMQSRASPVRPKYPRRSDIIRTVAAAKASGVDVAYVECLPDGVIRVGTDPIIGKAPANVFDQWDAAGQL